MNACCKTSPLNKALNAGISANIEEIPANIEHIFNLKLFFTKSEANPPSNNINIASIKCIILK